MTLSWSQWMKLGFGGMALLNKHRADIPLLRPLINDVFDLLESVVPPDDGKPVSHVEVIEKIRTGDLSAEERAVMDRASQTFGG